MTRLIFLAFGVAATLLLGSVEPLSAQTLQVGSQAPGLDIEHWISDGNGKFPQITEFESGKTYVVEFWATWCGPCLQAMPKLAQLQEKYGDKIQFISVSDEPLAEVSALMAEDYPGTGKTFGELTNAYCLTTDPDGSTHQDFMAAAGLSAVPSAFVVGPAGEIEAIAHPLEIEGVIEKLADGTWDRQAYYAKKEKRESLIAAVASAIDKEEIKKAFQLSKQLDEVTEPSDLVKTKLMQNELAIRVGDQEAQQFFADTAAQFNDEDGTVAAMTWMVVSMKYQGEEPSQGIIQVAEKKLSQQISEFETPNADRERLKGSMMDILSHLYFVQDRLDEAIANQEAAVKLNNDAELTDFLRQLQQKKMEQER